MESLIYTRSIFNVKAIAKQIAISIGVGTVYFIMCLINPFQLLTGTASILSFLNIRWANILKAFAISSPGAIFGIAAASWSFNVYSGKIALGAYPLMPTIHLLLAFAAYSFTQKWGRSTFKDIVILSVFAIFTALFASINLTGIAILFSVSTWADLFTLPILWKIFTHIATFLAGYPLVRYFEEKFKKVN